MPLQPFDYDELFNEEAPGAHTSFQVYDIDPQEPEDLGWGSDSLDDIWSQVEQESRPPEPAPEPESNRPDTPIEKGHNVINKLFYDVLGSAATARKLVGEMPARYSLPIMHTAGLITDEDMYEATKSKESMQQYQDVFNDAAENAPWWQPIKRMLGLVTLSSEEKKKMGIDEAAQYYFDKAKEFPVSEEVERLEATESLDELLSPTWYFERLGPEIVKLGIASAVTYGTGSPGAGAALIAGDVFAKRKLETMDLLEQNRPDLNYGEREILSDALAAQSAFTEYALEKFPLASITGKGKVSTNAIANKIGGFLTNTRLGRQAMLATAKGTDALDHLFPVISRTTKVGLKAARPAVQEAGEEVAAGNIDRFMNYLVGDEDALRQNVKQSIIEAVGGAAIGGPLGIPIAISETSPSRREERSAALRQQAEALAQTPEGMASLEKLSKIEAPSRRDFVEAGFDKNAIGNAAERQRIAQEYSPEAIEIRRGSEAAKAMEPATEGLGGPDIDAIDQEYDAGELSGREALVKRSEARRLKARALDIEKIKGPDDIRPMAASRQKLARHLSSEYDVDAPMAEAIAGTIQSSMTQEDVAALSYERGGKPGQSALFKIAETVKEVVGKEGQKQISSEEVFFGKVLPKAWQKAKVSLKQTKGRALVPVMRKQWKDLVDKAKAKVSPHKKYIPPPDPSPHGKEFEAIYSKAGSQPIISNMVSAYRQFTKDNPQFEQYYDDEAKKEQALLVKQYPELADKNNFLFYKMLNGIASAQTELGKNTEETLAVYGGFRQTGRVPVVMGESTLSPREKDAPVYRVPAGGRDVILPEDTDRVSNLLQEISGRLPPEVVAVINSREVPPGLTYTKGDKKGKPITSYRGYVEDFVGNQYITSGDKKTAQTTSRGFVAALLAEYIRVGDEAFRTSPRTAFEIGGGSSQNNKGQNYNVINKLLAMDQFQNSDGTPNIVALVEWLNERVPMKELSDLKKSLGFSAIPPTSRREIEDTVWVAEGQQEMIPRTFLFGPKVGAYMLNRMSDIDPRNSDYNTMDVWESRIWRGTNNDVNDLELGIASGLPRKVYMRQARDFVEEYKKQTGQDLKISAGQAGRWYLIKKIVAEAGYAKAGRDETIAGYTAELMDRYLRDVLGIQPGDFGTQTDVIAAAPPEAVTQIQAMGPIQAKRPKKSRGKYEASIASFTPDYIGPGPLPYSATPKIKGKPKTARQAAINLAKRFGVTIRPGRLKSKKAFAYYHMRNRTIRSDERNLYHLGVMTHEVAHKIDDVYSLTARTNIPPDVRQQLKDLDYDKTAKRDFEGFAEYIRIYLTKQNPDKYGTNKIHDWFMKVLDEAGHEDLKRDINVSRDEIAGYRGKGALQRVHDIFAGDKEMTFESVYKDKFVDVQNGVWGYLSTLFTNENSPIHSLTDAAKNNYIHMVEAHLPPSMSDEQKRKTANNSWLSLRRSLGHDPAIMRMIFQGTQAQNAERALRNGVFSLRNNKPVAGAITVKEIYKDIAQDEMPELADYMFSKAALERIDINPEYSAGVEESTLRQVVDTIEASPKSKRYHDAALNYTKYHNSLLELARDSGVQTISDTQRAIDKFKYYVPMTRMQPGENLSLSVRANFIGVGKLMKPLGKGSMLRVLDTRDSLVKRTTATYELAAAKKVETAIVELISKVPGLGFKIEQVDPKIQPNETEVIKLLTQLVDEGLVDEDTARMVRDVYYTKVNKATSAVNKRIGKRLGLVPDSNGEYDRGDILAEAENQGVPDATHVITTFKPIYKDDSKERIICVYNRHTGKPELYQVSDDIYKLYKDAGPAIAKFSSHFLIKWPRRIFKTGATGAALAFAGASWFMDTKYFLVKPVKMPDGSYASFSEKAGALKESHRMAFTHAVNRVKEAWKNEKLSGTLKMDDVGSLYIVSGGQMHTMLGDLLKTSLTPGQQFLSGKGKNIPRRILGGFMDVVASFELPSRIAAFGLALRKNQAAGGYTIDDKGVIKGDVPMWALLEAMETGMESTINFKVGGKVVKLVDQILPFTNATMAANRSLFLAAQNLGSSKEAVAKSAVAFSVYLGATVVMTALSEGLGEDEEEERPDWQKRKFFSVPYSSLRFPKSRELSFITDAVEIAVRNSIRAMRGKETSTMKDFGEYIGNQIKEHVPIPFLVHRSGAYGALVDSALNYEGYTDKPLESVYMLNLKPKDRTDKGVWWINNVIGGNTSALMDKMGVPEVYQPSPKKVDHIVKSTLAGYQKYLAIASGDKKPLAQNLNEAFLTAGFLEFETLGQTYWDMKEDKRKFEQEIATLRNKKYLDPSKAKEYDARIKETQAKLERHKVAEGLMKELEMLHYSTDANVMPLITGLSRWVQDKPALESYPNPLNMPREQLPKALLESEGYRKLKGKRRIKSK